MLSFVTLRARNKAASFAVIGRESASETHFVLRWADQHQAAIS